MDKSKNEFGGRHFTADVILWAVRWYLQFPISYRDLERMLADRGVFVDHTTVSRWTQRYAPEIDKRTRPHLRMTNGSWRVDETYIKVKGRWTYPYRAVDSRGKTIDFLLSGKRDAYCEAKNDHSRQESRLSEREQIDEEGGRVVALRTSAASQIPVPTVNRSRNTWIGFLAFFLSKGDRPPFLRPKPPYSYPGAPHQRPRCDLGHLRLLRVEGRRPQGGEA
jgi:hypothetical protein